MRERTAWLILFAMVVVGLIAWLTTSDIGPAWVKTSVIVGLAVVGAFAQSFVDWVLDRAAARRKAAEVPEQRSAENPAGLLRADRHVVPFIGREDEYAELREWCRDDKAPVRLMVGGGGVGKTRLALHLSEYLRSCGWSVAMVAADREADALDTLRAVTAHSIFLVVDYAETRTGLVTLLRSVAGHPAHVRVLLIARSVGDWWWQLGSDVAAVRDLVQAYPPFELSAQVDSARSPDDLVRAAVPHFAAALGVPTPSNIEVTVPGEVPLLVLHAAALLAVLRSRDPVAPAGRLVADLGVLDELLGHERRHWEHSAARAGLGHLSPVVLERVVAVACLFGTVDESDSAEILRRVPDLGDNEGLRRQVARWLRQLYPTGSGYWGPLQPELVAERHVIEQLVRFPELTRSGISELRPEQTHQMLTVLSLGAAHQPAGLVLLEQILRADIDELVFPALEVATTVGGGVGTVLVRVLTDAPLTPPTLGEIAAAIPHPTTALAGVAVAVTRRILDSLPSDTDLAVTARWHARLGIVAAQAGRPDALFHVETAVGLYRRLVEADRGGYLPDLARALHNLGIRHAEQGRHDAALEYTEQAVDHYRTLSENKPDDYRPDLAACLNNLGIWLAELDRHAEALPHLQEAVECYQALAEADPDRYLRDLAQALTNQDLSSSKVPLEPLPQLESVVEHNRALVENNRDRYLPDLALALHNLGNRYAKQDRRGQAQPRLAEALSCYRTLARSSPDRYRPDLAACLNDLGVNLDGLGRRAEALPCAREAVDLHRSLAATSPQRFRPELARSLDIVVVLLSRMRHYGDVLPHAEEAVSLHRLLTGTDPHRYRPELARALTNLSVSLSELTRHSEALPAAEEAVEIYRQLAGTQPDHYWPHLARALNNLAVDLAGLSRHAEADRCRHEADRIRGEHDDAGVGREPRRRWRRPARGHEKSFPSH